MTHPRTKRLVYNTKKGEACVEMTKSVPVGTKHGYVVSDIRVCSPNKSKSFYRFEFLFRYKIPESPLY